MDYLKYVDSSSFLHKLDPRTKFAFFVVMAVLTSVIKSFVALAFLLVFFIVIWKSCHIGEHILVLLSKLKILLLFIFIPVRLQWVPEARRFDKPYRYMFFHRAGSP